MSSLLNFLTHTILRTSKSIGNNTMKMLTFRYCAGPAYYRMLNRRLSIGSNKPAAVAPKETITHHFFVSGNLGRRKLSMQPKFVAAQENVVKTEPSKHLNGLLGFITLGIYTPLACVLLVDVAFATMGN